MPSVIYLTGFPGPAGVADIPSLGRFPIDAGVGAVDIQSSRGKSILLRASIIDPNGLTVLQGPPYPAGFGDFPQGFRVNFSGAVNTIWPAASLGRSSAPDDTPANTYVPGKLMPLNFEMKLFDGIDPAAGQGSSSGGLGALILVDPDGELDRFIGLSWDGATLDVLRGLPLARFDGFELVGRMTTAGLLYDPRKKEIRLRDLGWQLAQAELHGNRYGGSGGSDGDAALAGTMRPYGVGIVSNATPVQVNATGQVWQLSCSSIAGIDAVRDGGAALTFDANYATYTALVAAAVPSGRYATCLAEGYLRLGSDPALGITVDFRGDADIINGHAAPTTIGQIARRLACGRGTIRLSESQIDSVAMSAFEAERTAASGFYWRDAVSKAQALDQILAGTLGWWAVRLSGKLAIGYLQEPAAAPALTINYPEDFGGEPTQLDTYQPPRRATYIGWQANYTVQQPAQLAGSVGSTLALIWGQATRWSSSVSGIQPSVWPTSQVAQIPSGFRDEADAIAEASRQQILMGKRRERWRVKVPCDPFADLLGRVIQVNKFPRYGWGAARKFLCVGLSFASSRSVTLDLWG